LDKVFVIEQRVNAKEQEFEAQSSFFPSPSERCRHLQNTESDYREIQALLRRIDKVSGDYAHASIHIGSGNLWREYTADALESKINPWWAHQCNR